jgi:hypothetical protein
MNRSQSGFVDLIFSNIFKYDVELPVLCLFVTSGTKNIFRFNKLSRNKKVFLFVVFFKVNATIKNQILYATDYKLFHEFRQNNI